MSSVLGLSGYMASMDLLLGDNAMKKEFCVIGVYDQGNKPRPVVYRVNSSFGRSWGDHLRDEDVPSAIADKTKWVQGNQAHYAMMCRDFVKITVYQNGTEILNVTKQLVK